MKALTGLAAKQHNQNGEHDGGNHHFNLIRHADGGDDRVERKDQVQHHDLPNGHQECC